MAKSVRSKTRKRNNKAKREKVAKAEMLRCERIAQRMAEIRTSNIYKDLLEIKPITTEPTTETVTINENKNESKENTTKMDTEPVNKVIKKRSKKSKKTRRIARQRNLLRSIK
eukprot:TRINITY_DN19248_c0_g1_i1.p1 TRINITY_DN19248_c0_g1~~TRINITY_DN19248_c0_g1_i1.p1  ORF type:complete len:113 (-),score=18.38 TRINITY_DN19248_c0_g1_i1:54-392(-)